ncbi:unnamed protein product [Mycena citricolor]|uniref:Uncharacterized protein n=1 Tax=Mycena citricolor TaxID=2018698 RepID=A0AAD2HKV7_9AGAR|nr:unnamed protein product [Mycena citricolor]
MSRQPTRDSPSNDSSVAGVDSLLEQLQADNNNSEEPSSGSAARRSMSKDSEGYPSWLPKRPLHPAPASTFQGSINDAGPSEQPFVGGRKATPRSVRIVSMNDHDASYGAEKDRREPTDQTKVGVPAPRVWSRGMGVPLPAGSHEQAHPRIPQPRFKAKGLHLELVQNPGFKSRLYFLLFPLLVFAHIPLQTFFDFNAVFMLIQIAKFPNPLAPGVPGSGRNWELAAAAYAACWLVWIFPVFVIYELVYSFARRWRVKRPVMLPLYLSSPAFNFVCLSSYANFCFMQHLRWSAFFGEHGGMRDGLAETFWLYSQNLPTVILLLPRAGLCLALLLGFWSPDPLVVAMSDSGTSNRDETFFRADGTLTGYSRGVLIASAVWAAWKALVVLISWIGLWILSGAGCAGLCGPRNRWEEEEAEKRMSAFSDNVSELEALPWSWRMATALRVQDTFDFCLTVRPRWTGKHKEEAAAVSQAVEPKPVDGMEQIMAAIGLPTVPAAARRGALSGDLFDTPISEKGPEFADIIPKVVNRSSWEPSTGPSAPLMALPYPFTTPGAQVSSQDRVPFPPSPEPTDSKDSSGSLEEVEHEDEDEEDEDEDDEEMLEGMLSEGPSSGRASGSMSSLGQPVASRYPFQFRHPNRGHARSGSSGAASHMTPVSHNTRSTQSQNARSTFSRATQSTGNPESSESQSPQSQHTLSSSGLESREGGIRYNSAASAIPMPPRHPRSRTRSRTVPNTVSESSSSSSGPPIDFPRSRGRMDSRVTDAFGVVAPNVLEPPLPDEPEITESEGSHEAEREDQLGLLSLSAAPSPRSSFTALRHRASNVSGRRGYGSSSSHSRTHSHSGTSSSRSRAESLISVSARSRAQSLLQNIGAASQSSIEIVQVAMRNRANSSMARLEEDLSDSRTNSHSRSGSASDAVPSSVENHTFGMPLHAQPLSAQPPVLETMSEGSPEVSPERLPAPAPSSYLLSSQSQLSVFTAPSTQQISERTVSRPPSSDNMLMMPEPAGIPIPTLQVPQQGSGDMGSSYPDVSTAAGSYVTAAPTIEGSTTESSDGRTVYSLTQGPSQMQSHMGNRGGEAWQPYGPA